MSCVFHLFIDFWRWKKQSFCTYTPKVKITRVSFAAAYLLVSLYLISLSYLLWFVDFEPRFRRGGRFMDCLSVRPISSRITRARPSSTMCFVCLIDSFILFMFSTSVPLFQRGRHRYIAFRCLLALVFLSSRFIISLYSIPVFLDPHLILFMILLTFPDVLTLCVCWCFATAVDFDKLSKRSRALGSNFYFINLYHSSRVSTIYLG